MQCHCFLVALLGLLLPHVLSQQQCSMDTTASRFIDITASLDTDTLDWGSTDGLGDFRMLEQSKGEGDICNASKLKGLRAHTATHVDSPAHFYQHHYDSGKGVESLDLAVLNAAVVKELNIPAGTIRLLLKTQNTRRRLMSQTAFATDYTAFTKDGAEYLVENTDVQLIGIDYLSVAIFEDLTNPHLAILGKGLIPLEGLVLEHVEPGLYDLHCLPLKLVGSDGAPTRCILEASA